MIDILYRKLAVPPEKRYLLLGRHRELRREFAARRARAGLAGGCHQAGFCARCCAAFGGGLSWGAFSIRWPHDADAAVGGSLDVAAPAANSR